MNFLYTLLLIMAPLLVAQGPDEKPWYKNTNEHICCECVPYLNCNENGQLKKHVLMKSNGVNVQKCNNRVDVCCLVQGAQENCSSFQPGPKAKVSKVPQPNIICECAPWEVCPPDEVVTDGKGGHSDIGLTTHSKCPKPLEVCCLNSHDHGNAKPNVGVRVGGGQPQEGDCSCVPSEQCIEGHFNTDGFNILEPRVRGDGKCPDHEVFCCNAPKSGAENRIQGNYLTLIGFVTFVSVTKGILLSQ